MSHKGAEDRTSPVFEIHRAQSPGIFRRLAALSYDLVLLFSVLVVATAFVVVPYGLITGNPFPHDEPVHHTLLQLYLAAVIGAFFVYFWTRAGQTLGMRSWRFRLVRDDGSGLGARDALVRLAWATICLAPAGIGFLWMLFDRERLTWYDRLSHTRPVLLEHRRETQRDAD